ncbi:hypothetical protein JCM6882_008851 [Rhodosporidiobolus microsporus]
MPTSILLSTPSPVPIPSSSHFASSSAPPPPPKPSHPPPAPSSFLSRMPHFPLFASSWATKDDEPSQRDRRFSFGASKGKARVEHSPPPAPQPPLKRSKSARTSLIATARRLSTSTKRTKDFPAISRPVLAERNDLEADESAFMRDYRDRAPMFAMSSPELATPQEEMGQWAAFPVEEVSRPIAGLPHSPMVKWDTSAEKENRSSFVPLSQQSPRPFSATSSTPSAESFNHFSEASTDSSTGPATPEMSTSPLQAMPVLRARSPKTRWEPPIVPSLSPPPQTPVEPVFRSTSRSPPLDSDTREAARAEALAKLTSPTPTNSRFPDDLTSFPFPAVSSVVSSVASTPRAPPPRPLRPPPAIPSSGTSHSLILPLPSARDSLGPEDPTTPPPLTRSNTVGLHPSPVPLDIDFKGRLVRARNSHPGNGSPGLTIGSNSSFGTSSSPGSSRFSEWGPPAGSRKSSETSFSFSLQQAEENTPPPPSSKGGLYALAADRRLVESAVDVLAVVDEDETPISAAPAVRVKRSPSKQGGSSGSPARRTSMTKKRISLDSSLPSHSSSAEVLVLSRPRNRPGPSSTSSSATIVDAPLPSKPIRPFRLSQTDRTFSSGVVVEPTRNEKDELGLHSSIAMPFPLAPGKRAASPPPSSSSPQRARAGKRCLSELHAEDRSASSEREKLYGLGLGLPSSMANGGVGGVGGRTRHQSFAVDTEEAPGEDLRQRRASRRVSSGAAVRTKLVLREKGKPTLTYQLGECIGRGQFGSVYRALNLNTGQVVAVKRIQLDGKSESEIDQLSNEIGLLQRLAHPSVVKYEGVVRTEHYLNIILEYVENGSLEKTLRQFGCLPESLVASYAVKILEGLTYLHDQGVVHCDLKAANILSTKQGNIKLSDFGVSLNLHAIKATKGPNPGANEANGTPNWMAPEVIELNGATASSDIWSLAATIIELIDGRPPYADLVAMSAMFRIVEDDEPPIPERCSDELKAFLRRCFKKDPRERPTAEELFEDPWLLTHWDPCKDMRPQDSLPFLRRISTEYRRPTLNLPQALEPINNGSETDLSSSPALRPPVLPFAQSGEGNQSRESFDSGYRASGEVMRSPEPSFSIHGTEETHRPHSFVKTTFSKAIDCRICGEPTRRHAVLCKDCGCIAHRRCKEFAPSCDLRAQLLGTATQPIPIPMSRTISNAAPVASSPSHFALTDLLPFSKSRRPKAPTPTSSADSTGLPTVALSPVPPTQSRASGAIRHLSNALLPTKTRTPEHTPPSSLNGKGGRGRSFSIVKHHAAQNSESSLSAAEGVPPQTTAAEPARRISLDAPPLLRHKNSHNVVVQTQSGARALARKNSHSRTVSQPVNPPPSGSKPAKGDGDCIVM